MSVPVISKEIIEIAKKIIEQGNDVEIRRKGDGYIVMEIKRKIKYPPKE